MQAGLLWLTDFDDNAALLPLSTTRRGKLAFLLRLTDFDDKRLSPDIRAVKSKTAYGMLRSYSELRSFPSPSFHPHSEFVSLFALVSFCVRLLFVRWELGVGSQPSP
jgi:hypothetical protein